MNNPLSGIDPSGYAGEPPKEETEVEPPPTSVTVTAKQTGTFKQTGSNLSRKSFTVTASTGGNGASSANSGGGAAQMEDGTVTFSPGAGFSLNAGALSGSNYTSKEKKAIRSCRTQVTSSCGSGGGLTQSDIDSVQGNPAGTTKPDTYNLELSVGRVGNVQFHDDGTISIRLRYVEKGDQDRVNRAIVNIRKEYGKEGVDVNFRRVESASDAELIMFGASLSDMVSEGLACDCEVAMQIGGWAPFESKLLMLNAEMSGSTRKIDAHEFGHKLGLRHRTDNGILDYPPDDGRRDTRRVRPSDVQRLRNLYEY